MNSTSSLQLHLWVFLLFKLLWTSRRVTTASNLESVGSLTCLWLTCWSVLKEGAFLCCSYWGFLLFFHFKCFSGSFPHLKWVSDDAGCHLIYQSSQYDKMLAVSTSANEEYIQIWKCHMNHTDISTIHISHPEQHSTFQHLFLQGDLGTFSRCVCVTKAGILNQNMICSSQ